MGRQHQFGQQQHDADCSEEDGDFSQGHTTASPGRTTIRLPAASRTISGVPRVTKPLSLTTETICEPPAASRNSALPLGRRSVTALPRAPTAGASDMGSMLVRLPTMAASVEPTVVVRIK